MDANLNLLTATAPNALTLGDGPPSAGSQGIGRNPMLGKEFANLMRALLPDSERQDLAASGLTAGQTGLQTLSLGQKFALVTADAPQPDANSLAAFAKAQGLGDSAVKALFGELTELGSPRGLLLERPTLADRSQADMTPQAPQAIGELASSMLPTAPPPSWFTNPQIAASAPEPVLPTDPVSPGLTLALAGQPTAADPNTSHNVSAQALTGLLAASGASATLKQLSPAAVNGSGPARLDADGAELPPEPGPLDAMRLRLAPTWENMTRQLAKAAGSDLAQPWANLVDGLLSANKKSTVPELEIDLGGADIGALTDTGDGLGTVSATFNNDNRAQIGHSSQAPATLTLTEKNAAEGTAGGGADRAAQIAQLADKLGQALSERLQQQIEQGQWRLELRLKPAHLGKISVELDMNSGGLDALFKSDNPLTRELISQGSAKLRDNLAQVGMTVANVWVNGDGQQKTGGNPTPRQPSVSSNITNPEPNQETVLKIQAPRAKSADGWDEMV